MSSASTKNREAMKALFGNEALGDRVNATRIAVVLPDTLPRAGSLLAHFLADTLSRLWPNIDFSGAAAEDVLTTARAAATAGGAEVAGFQRGWAPPYNVIVCVGCAPPEQTESFLRVGADGWVSSLGKGATCGDDSNPVGPAYAAAIGAAQVFRRVFDSELADMEAPLLEEWSADVRTLFGAEGIEVGPLVLRDTVFFGIGAVTHGLMLLLERWPGNIEGEVDLVDQDTFGSSNGQRYAYMRAEHIDKLKVDVMKARLELAHPGLAVRACATDMNSYCEERGYDPVIPRAVVGLDSAEARRQVAFKLPRQTINMWTGGERAGAARYSPTPTNACLACDYLENVDAPLDEVALLHKQTGLRPDKLRSLLGGRPLTDFEAREVAGKWGIDHASLVGQPLRSVLPHLCATGRLQLEKNAEATDVPFAFGSLIAGIGGFMMLLKDLAQQGRSEGWSHHLFKAATPKLLRTLSPNLKCVRCTEANASAIESATEPEAV